MSIVWSIVLGVVAYIVGSIPTAYVVVRVFTGKNILDYGTGNVGTMNTHRATNNKLLTLLVLLGDASKGMIAFTLASWMAKNAGLSNDVSLILAGVAVVVGHNWSLFLKLKGGKGLATAAGFFLLVNPLIVVFWIAIWIPVMLLSGYFVFGQIVATVALPVVVMLWKPSFVWLVALICIPVFIKHAPRLKNVFNGTEPKMYYKERNREAPNTIPLRPDGHRDFGGQESQDPNKGQ